MNTYASSIGGSGANDDNGSTRAKGEGKEGDDVVVLLGR